MVFSRLLKTRRFHFAVAVVIVSAAVVNYYRAQPGESFASSVVPSLEPSALEIIKEKGARVIREDLGELVCNPGLVEEKRAALLADIWRSSEPLPRDLPCEVTRLRCEDESEWIMPDLRRIAAAYRFDIIDPVEGKAPFRFADYYFRLKDNKSRNNRLMIVHLANRGIDRKQDTRSCGNCFIPGDKWDGRGACTKARLVSPGRRSNCDPGRVLCSADIESSRGER